MSVDQPSWWPEVFWKMQSRRQADDALFRHMIAVRDRYNGPMVFPLTDVDGPSTHTTPQAMLLADAIDSGSEGCSTAQPSIVCPPLDGTKATGTRSRQYADIRRGALQGRYHEDGMNATIMPRAYKHLYGYGTCNMIVLPDYERECATVNLRDPLTAYPELRTPDDVRAPLDCGYVFGRSTTWLVKNYPQVANWAGAAGVREDTIWDVVEWVDKERIAIGVLGPRETNSNGRMDYAGVQFRNYKSFENGMFLRAWPNKAGIVPIGTPRRVTLDMIMGQVAQMVPASDMLAMLSTLKFIAAEKDTFPDLALIGNQIGRTPTLEGGMWRDGRSGEFNTILDGDVKVISTSAPGGMTRAVEADIERNIRNSTGLSGAQSGELNGSLRSGQTINSLYSMSADPKRQANQRLMAHALVPINEAIIETELACWPTKKYTVFSGGVGDDLTEYVPETHFETRLNNVLYPYPGLDASQISVAVLQLVSAGLESRKTARKMHPMIANADRSAQEILEEQLEDALMGSYTQRLAAGTIADVDVADLWERIQNGEDPVKAIVANNRQAQERAAATAPPPTPDQAVAPETLSGTNPAGTSGVEQAPAPIPPSSQGQVNLDQVLQNLRHTTPRPSAA